MTPAIAPCKAGFSGCDEMRAEAIRKHPRTPRLAECSHYPIPPEQPERLRGPEIGARVMYRSLRYPQYDGPATVTERSYVWAPGERSGSRRYDLKVIRFDRGGTLLVDDKDLTALEPATA